MSQTGRIVQNKSQSCIQNNTCET